MTNLRRIFSKRKKTMGQSTITLAFLISNLECLNMNSLIENLNVEFYLLDTYSKICSYLLLKLLVITPDSTQIDLKLVTPILAKIE